MITLLTAFPDAPPVAVAVAAALTAAGFVYSAPGPAPAPGFVISWATVTPHVVYLSHWNATGATGPDPTAILHTYGAALTVADASFLIGQVYTGGRLELVVCQVAAQLRPAAPVSRPVCPPVEADPTTRDLLSAVLWTDHPAYDGPERRSAHRTALGHLLTWQLRRAHFAAMNCEER